MNFEVDWNDDALSALAASWVGALDREAVTAAQEAIDRLLAADPYGNGWHVSEGLYAIDVPPLRAQFEVAEREKLVTVVSVGELP
jgi:hypothetical protein